jgi:hypothetical protein
LDLQSTAGEPEGITLTGGAYALQGGFWTVASSGCPTASPPQPEPTPLAKNRYISLIPGNAGTPTAIRVRLISLQHPDPPNLPQFPAPDFSAFHGQARYVGPPGVCTETDVPATTFLCASLQCDPHYADWGTLVGSSVVHVGGAEIVPSSVYDVQIIAEGCDVSVTSSYSGALTIATARWGDVVAPFQAPSPATLTQPNILDVAGVVDKFKGVATAPIKARAQLQPNLPDPRASINILDVANTVDAFKNFAYPYAGPVACP